MARVLVTAGPTRESLDPVRYLSNRSSGRMGFAIARALVRAGHEVVLVAGPVALRTPPEVERMDVESAEEMLQACRWAWPECDVLYAVAAVADYRPAERADHKLKRKAGEGRTIELVPNPDVVATLAADKEDRLVIGFALESENGEEEAQRKMKAKHLDFVVLNGPEAQGAKRTSLTLLGADGTRANFGPADKNRLARRLVEATLG